MNYNCNVLDLGTYQLKFGSNAEDLPVRRRSQLGRKISYNYESQIVIGGMLNKDDYYTYLNPHENQSFDFREYNVFPLFDGGNVNSQGIKTISDFLQGTTSLLIVDNQQTIQNKYTRERLIMLFELIDLQNFLIINSQAVALFSEGFTTGAVIDSGEQGTKFIPIYDGTPIKEGSVTLNYGGGACVEQSKKISHFQFQLNMAKEEEIHRHLLYQVKNSTFMLPDGNKLSIGGAGEKVTETFLQKVLSQQLNFLKGIEQPLYNIMKDHIILSGGVWKLPNCVPLFKSQLRNGFKIIDGKDDIQLKSWLGAKIFSQIAMAQKKFVTREFFDEFGAYQCLSRFFV